MAFQFDEQYFGEPIPLNIGKALHENNSLEHGFYEVLANALDGGAGKRPHVEFDRAMNTVTIRNEGHVIKPEHFRVGSGRNPKSIHSQHGFGMKDYIATFIRFGCKVGIKSGRLQYSFELKNGPLGEVVFLTVLPREDGHDTVVEIKGPLDLINMRTELEIAKGKFLAFLDLAPLSQSSHLDVYPGKIGHTGTLDYIFINGAQKTVSNYKLSFIYDFKKISDKDRKLIGLEHDAKLKQMKIFQDLKAFVMQHRDMDYQPSSLERTWIKSAEKAQHEFKAVGISHLQRRMKTHFNNVLLEVDRLFEVEGRLMLSPSREYYFMCRVLANRIMNHIKNLDGVQSVQLVGSLSREVGLIGSMDIDLLVVKKPECEGTENASAEHVALSSIIKENLLRNEPAVEVYLESEKLIKFMFDAIHVDVVIVGSGDTRAIEQFIVPIQIATFYNQKYPYDVSVVAAMKLLLGHAKFSLEKPLKSVILEFIVWNEREEMISEEGWPERCLTPAEQMRELFYRCVTFVLSYYSIPKRFTKWETILRNAGVCAEKHPDDTSLLSFNVDSIKSFAQGLCVDEREESFHLFGSYGGYRGDTVRYNGRVW